MKTIRAFIKQLSAVTLIMSLIALTGSVSAGGHETPKYGGVMEVLHAPTRPLIGWPPDLMANNIVSVVQTCMETLLRGDKEGGVIPWLAEAYQVAPDKKSITFYLRKGVKFHDGSEMTAEVVKWNLDNMIQAKLKREWASVDVIDNYRVRVNLVRWQSNILLSFIEGIATPFIISKATYDKNGLDWVRNNPVGTGPFKFVSFQRDVNFKTVKNPDYWLKGKPYLDGIEFTFVGDTQTSKMLVQSGKYDLTGAMLGKQAADYAAMPDLKVIPRAESVWVLVPDNANADSPWADKKVREAIAYAINREAIAKGLGKGYWKAPYQVPPRSSLSFNPNVTLKRQYNLEKAKQLLKEAGYPNGFETTIYGMPAADRNAMIILQSQLAEVGIKVELLYHDFAKWVTYMGRGTWPPNGALFTPVPRFDLNFMGGTQFLMFNIGQGWERTPRVQQAFGAALGAPTLDIEKIRAINDIFIEDALLIPVHEGGICRVQRPYVHASFDNRGYILFWDTESAWMDK